MITKDIYKKVKQYSTKLSKHDNDVDDITQNAFELLLANPVEGKLPNKFYFTLAKRGADRFYYKPNKAQKFLKKISKVLVNQEHFISDENEFFDKIEHQQDSPERVYMVKQILAKMQEVPVKNWDHQKSGLTANEHRVLLLVLDGEEVAPKDHTHFDNLKKKLASFFK